jgi:hypothetical protein
MNFLAELKRRNVIRMALISRRMADRAGCRHRVPGFRVSQLGVALGRSAAHFPRTWLTRQFVNFAGLRMRA